MEFIMKEDGDGGFCLHDQIYGFKGFGMYSDLVQVQGVQKYGDKLVPGLCRNHMDPYMIIKLWLFWF
jgi:hypothetical protein